jgi:hypothetical protein
MFNGTKVMAKKHFGVDLMGAILKSNMAAMLRHRQWHHLIGGTQKPRYSHLNYVCICNRTKVMAKKRFVVGLMSAILESNMATM